VASGGVAYCKQTEGQTDITSELPIASFAFTGGGCRNICLIVSYVLQTVQQTNSTDQHAILANKEKPAQPTLSHFENNYYINSN